MNLKKDEILNEKIILNELDSGMKLYHVPKERFREKFCMVGINFGSVYKKYLIDDIEKEIPFGVAHFLEHKLFDDEKLNLMAEFSKFEGEVNAYTSFTSTTYYFECVNNFFDNFNLLLRLIDNPLFIKKRVDAEKGIIDSEIKMYKDSPGYIIQLNAMEKMFINQEFFKNIAGDEEDILEINERILYSVYNDFYYPENMYILSSGDIDYKKIIAFSNDYLRKKENKKIINILKKESEKVLYDYIETKMAIENTHFLLCFKESDSSIPIAKKIVIAKILLDIIFGESSDFYEKMYSKGLIDNTFNGDYNNFKFFGYSALMGISKKPKELRKEILEEIETTKLKGIIEERYDIIKKKHLGRFITEFNNISNISMILQDCLSKGFDFIDLVREFNNITLEDLNVYLKNNFSSNNNVLSVVTPK